MKRKIVFRSAFFEPRIFISFLLVFGGILLVLGAIGISPATTAKGQTAQQTQAPARPALLTPEEAQKMAAGIQQLVSQSADGLVQVQHANGAVSMDLQGRFQNVTVAKREADGTLTQGCVDNPDTAAAFFELDPQTVGGTPRTAQSAPVPAKLEDR
jgi:hypothetical protein